MMQGQWITDGTDTSGKGKVSITASPEEDTNRTSTSNIARPSPPCSSSFSLHRKYTQGGGEPMNLMFQQ